MADHKLEYFREMMAIWDGVIDAAATVGDGP
jgi:hypothetical protein